jgi:hypothetical protein
MTEAEWLAFGSPEAMLGFLRDSGRLSERKARLFAFACCNRVFDSLRGKFNQRVLNALATLELYADWLVNQGDAEDARADVETALRKVEAESRNVKYRATPMPGRRFLLNDKDRDFLARTYALEAVRAGFDRRWPEEAASRAREAIKYARGSQAEPGEGAAQAALLRDLFSPTPLRALSTAASDGGTSVQLAAAIYEEGDFSGERLGVLADALEESGCCDAPLLGHLRSPGPHFRGCFALDSLLDKG